MTTDKLQRVASDNMIRIFKKPKIVMSSKSRHSLMIFRILIITHFQVLHLMTNIQNVLGANSVHFYERPEILNIVLVIN